MPPAKQRAALNLIATGIFSADSFRFKPEFLRSMGIDYLDIGLSGRGTPSSTPTSACAAACSALQVGVLNTLLSDAVLARLQDSEIKVSQADQALTLSELFATLRGSIWSELKSPAARSRDRAATCSASTCAASRRVLTRPSSATPADAVALLPRGGEERFRRRSRPRPAAATAMRSTRAHLIESAGTLDEALKAPLVRQGV